MRTTRFPLLGTVGIMLAAACGGGEGGGITPPPPPPTEELQLFFLQPSNNSTMSGLEAKIVVTVSATSNLKTISPSDVNITANGVTVTGFSATLPAVIGLNKVTAMVQGKQKILTKEIEVGFNPRLVCKAVVANPENESISSAQPKVTFSKGSASASVMVNQNGDCSLTGNLLATEDGLMVSVSDATGQIHSMSRTFSRADIAKGLNIVLMPRSWKMTLGSFSGQTVEIDVSLACKDNSLGNSFYNCSANGPGWTFTPYAISSVPAPMAIKNDLSTTGQTFSPAGEANLWESMSYVNTTVGRTHFRKATTSEVVFPNGFALVVDSTRTGGAPAMSGTGLSGNDIIGGNITFWGAADATVPGNARHEIIHMLRVGHGCGWDGLMSEKCGYVHSNSLVPQDVAYLQLWTRLAELNKKYDAGFSNWTVSK